jgi:hypothetical protein
VQDDIGAHVIGELRKVPVDVSGIPLEATNLGEGFAGQGGVDIDTAD